MCIIYAIYMLQCIEMYFIFHPLEIGMIEQSIVFVTKYFFLLQIIAKLEPFVYRLPHQLFIWVTMISSSHLN